jgi:hypothetical protein
MAMEQGPPLYSKDCYRIHAIYDRDDHDGDDPDRGDADRRIAGYLVMTTAGLVLRRETRLEDARDWIEARLERACRAPASTARGRLRR